MVLCGFLPFYWMSLDIMWGLKFVVLAVLGVAGHSTLIKALSIVPASFTAIFMLVWYGLSRSDDSLMTYQH